MLCLSPLVSLAQCAWGQYTGRAPTDFIMPEVKKMPQMQDFSQAVGNALIFAAQALAGGLFMYEFCWKEGVAKVHFKWPESVRRFHSKSG